MKYQIWECKIVVPEDAVFPEGFDFPPRHAAMQAVEDAGITVIDCFSGWGSCLTDTEKEIVDYNVQRRCSSSRDC